MDLTMHRATEERGLKESADGSIARRTQSRGARPRRGAATSALTNSAFSWKFDLPRSAPQHGGWWLIGPGEWAIRVQLFSLWVDVQASLSWSILRYEETATFGGKREQTLARLGGFDGDRPRGILRLCYHDMQPGSHPRRGPCLGGCELPSLHDLHHQGRHL